MADKPASERTEQPTPERIRKAREEGKVPQSKEVPSAMMIAALLGCLALAGGGVYDWAAGELSAGLGRAGPAVLDVDSFRALMGEKLLALLTVLAPFLAVGACTSVLSSLLVGGWAFSPKALKFDPARINPIKGLKNLFSLRSVVNLLVSVSKLAVILLVSWQFLASKLPEMLALQWASPTGALQSVAGLLAGLVFRIAAALAAIAGIDWLYQWWQYRKQLRMTRQEVKEERKQHELSPEVRGRMRSMQMAAARSRMLRDVPQADVVVTNPTHYAVALRYDGAAMDAPQVLAKGADVLCSRIKEIAREHEIPIVERPQLARALYAACEPGDAIPEAMFVAVAEVLAMIYRLRRRRLGGVSGRPKS